MPNDMVQCCQRWVGMGPLTITEAPTRRRLGVGCGDPTAEQKVRPLFKARVNYILHARGDAGTAANQVSNNDPTLPASLQREPKTRRGGPPGPPGGGGGGPEGPKK